MNRRFLRTALGVIGKQKLVTAAVLALVGGIVAASTAAAMLVEESEGPDPPHTLARALTEEEARAGVPLEAQTFDSLEAALESIGADPADFDVPAAQQGDGGRTEEPPSDPEPSKHCTVRIEPLRPGEKVSEMSEADCFGTFSQAIYNATRGEVRLLQTVQPRDVTQEMLASSSRTVISIDYSSPNYQGSTLVWYVNNSFGCYTGWSYANPTMPSGWNNVVSSARSYGGCNNNPHYEHTYYGGALIFCTCSTMGVMDNQTSSEKWYR